MPGRRDEDTIEHKFQIKQILNEDEERDKRIEILEEWKKEEDIKKEAKKLMAARCAVVWGGFLGVFGIVGGFVAENYEVVRDAIKAALKVLAGRL